MSWCDKGFHTKTKTFQGPNGPYVKYLCCGKRISLKTAFGKKPTKKQLEEIEKGD